VQNYFPACTSLQYGGQSESFVCIMFWPIYAMLPTDIHLLYYRSYNTYIASHTNTVIIDLICKFSEFSV
jgi:hypothetical protein